MRDATHKLSKRDGDAYYGDFLARGFMKEAILNYIALLGWHPGGKFAEQEIFSLAQMVDAFDSAGLSKSPAVFDHRKLAWLNGEYLKAMPPEEFHEKALPYIRQSVQGAHDTAYLAALVQSRAEKLNDIPEMLDFIDAVPDYSTDLYIHKKMKTDAAGALSVLRELEPLLSGAREWTQDCIHALVAELVERLGVKNGQVLWPLRVALSGKASTPMSGMELAVFLGREQALARLRAAITKLEA
jgi:glutamyl-tRNA synthetase